MSEHCPYAVLADAVGLGSRSQVKTELFEQPAGDCSDCLAPIDNGISFEHYRLRDIDVLIAAARRPASRSLNTR